MARGLSYRDAAVLLGGGPETKVVAALNKIVAGVMLAATAGGSELALSLFDAKGEFFNLGSGMVTGLADRLRGLGRYERSRRLEAAHAVISVAAFFETLAEVRLPRDLQLSKAEQVGLATGEAPGNSLARAMLATTPLMPSPHFAHEDVTESLSGLYSELTEMTRKFVQELAAWGGLTPARRVAVRSAIQLVPRRAIARYETLYLRLLNDFPEFRYWTNTLEHQTTRGEVRQVATALSGLAVTLDRMRIGRDPVGARIGLAKKYRATLGRPPIELGDAVGGLQVPTAEKCYLDPHFRIGQPDLNEVANEYWWQQQPLRTDLQDFLVGHLTSPVATKAPLVVLGHPGAGKSLLTKMLAARLPASDFLVVRVVLREVPSEADLQTQIETAVRAETGEASTWPALVASAGDALPVLLLDGFDELLQATGQSQSDYLERITAFQQRECDLDRPVAVVVTSRLTVADRVRPVFGVVTVFLESFDDEQVTTWLAAWHDSNVTQLKTRDLKPLGTEVALRHRDLACQPLLLLLLALYDADCNALHAGVHLNDAALYEGLLTTFARREVRKLSKSLSPSQLDAAVQREMLRLSIVAFAMFNRNQLWVCESDLDADLRALLGGGDVADGARLTAAELLLGRFYFVYVAQATVDHGLLKTYEFLHATFGEFLVARLAIHEVLAAPSTGGLTRALLSFAPLTIRRTTMDFAADLVAQLLPDDRDRLAVEALGLFRLSLLPHDGSSLDEYRPITLTVPEQVAIHSANLFLLAAFAAGEITSAQLFPDANDHATEWTRIAQLWQSQLPSEAWRNLVDNFAVRREYLNHRRIVRLVFGGAGVDEINLDWTHDFSSTHPASVFVHNEDMRADTAFSGGTIKEIAMHTLDPFSGPYEEILTQLNGVVDPGLASPARSLIALWLKSTGEDDPAGLAAAHAACLRLAMYGVPVLGDGAARDQFRRMVLRQLEVDRDRLPDNWLVSQIAEYEESQEGSMAHRQDFIKRLRQRFNLD